MSKKFLPLPNHPTSATATKYVSALEKLDDILSDLDTDRADITPLQRQLVDRFIDKCRFFCRDMLATDASTNAGCRVSGLPVTDKPAVQAYMPITGNALIIDVCLSNCDELEQISLSVQRSLREGLADVMASISAEMKQDSLGREALDAMTMQLRYLIDQIEALFDSEIGRTRQRQLIAQAEIRATNDRAEGNRGVTVSEFMQSVKPRVKSQTLRERLEPFILQLNQLREAGYSYVLCAQFLRQNGINTSPAAIGGFLSDARMRKSAPTQG